MKCNSCGKTTTPKEEEARKCACGKNPFIKLTYTLPKKK
jgi:hypothetical protein